MKIIQFICSVVGLQFLLGAPIYAAKFDRQDFDAQCRQFQTQYGEYVSEKCADITIVGACVNHTGFFGFKTEEEYKEFSQFGENAMQSCAQACDNSDLGACYILGLALSKDAKTYISYAGSEDKDGFVWAKENIDDDFEGYTYMVEACKGGIASACRDAGTLAHLYWPALRSYKSIAYTCTEEDVAPVCDRNRLAQTRIDKQNWFAESPMEFYIVGCELDDAKSCKLAFDFLTGYPELVGADVDPEFYRKRACDIGIKLFKCD